MDFKLRRNGPTWGLVAKHQRRTLVAPLQCHADGNVTLGWDHLPSPAEVAAALQRADSGGAVDVKTGEPYHSPDSIRRL